MKKNKVFLLAALMSILPFLFFAPFAFTIGSYNFAYYLNVIIYYKTVGLTSYIFVVTDGLIALIAVGYLLFAPLLIILSILFLALSSKKKMLVIPAYVLTFLCLLISAFTVGNFSILMLINYVSSFLTNIGHFDLYLPFERILLPISNCMYSISYLVCGLALLPALVLFVLSLFFIKERKKKEPELIIEEQPQIEEGPQE